MAPNTSPLPAVRLQDGHVWRTDGRCEPVSRPTPVEVAVGLSMDGRPHTVLMATPGDYEDLALGFAVSEAIAEAADVEAIEVREVADGVLVDLRLAPSAPRKRGRPRGLEGRSSCGLCGVQRLADVMRPLPVVEGRRRFAPEAVQRAVRELDAGQTLGRETRATHAAAFAQPDGRVVLVREDVGRHNALDKLGGAMLRAGLGLEAGFVVVTSRCSFEMVEKTARFGAPMIVAISAPTELAIRRADEAGVTLVALARADGHTVFSHAQRLGHTTTEALEHA
jgi:FdhD protein